jgi:hypothetical protein
MQRRIVLALWWTCHGCVFVDGPHHEDHGPDGQTSSGETTDDPHRAPPAEADSTGADACAPTPETSCVELGAPEVRALGYGELLAVSTRDGIDDLVVSETSVRRDVPLPDQPWLFGVFLLSRPTIEAPLSAASRDALATAVAMLPETPGPFGGWPEGTLRVGDRQQCYALQCPAFETLHALVTALDAQLLQAWRAGDEGVLHPVVWIDPPPWPLPIPSGDGGAHELDQADWESLTGPWYLDGAGRLAYVEQSCSGAEHTCDRWMIDVTIVAVADSPLTASQHRDLLGLPTLWPLFAGQPLDGDAFAAVRDADVLRFVDPDDPAITHWFSALALPTLTLDGL